MDLNVFILILGLIFLGFCMIYQNKKESYRGGPSEVYPKNVYGSERGCNMYGIKEN